MEVGKFIITVWLFDLDKLLNFERQSCLKQMQSTGCKNKNTMCTQFSNTNTAVKAAQGFENIIGEYLFSTSLRFIKPDEGIF